MTSEINLHKTKSIGRGLLSAISETDAKRFLRRCEEKVKRRYYKKIAVVASFKAAEMLVIACSTPKGLSTEMPKCKVRLSHRDDNSGKSTTHWSRHNCLASFSTTPMH